MFCIKRKKKLKVYRCEPEFNMGRFIVIAVFAVLATVQYADGK